MPVLLKSEVSSTTKLHDFCVGFPGGGLLLDENRHLFTAYIQDKDQCVP